MRSLEELTIQEKEELVRHIAQKKAGLIDLDWQEICEKYDLNISADTLRKAGVGIKLATDANMLNDKPSTTVAQISGGYVERQELRDLTRQVSKLYRSESRSELLREAVLDAVNHLDPIRINHCQTISERNDFGRTLVVALGDFHYGADIHVTGLMGETLNEYNSKVFEERMERLLAEIRGIADKEQISQVRVFLVGDLIDGMLRQSQLMRLEFGMVESTIRLSEYLSYWLAELADGLYVDVYATMGNHSEVRPLKSKNREFEEENLEKIIMWYLKARLDGEENIFVDAECKRYTMVDVEGFKFLLLHGDGEKSVVDIAKDTVNLYGRSIDYFVCGHKHKEQEWPSGNTNDGHSVIIRVPSICGVDRYAQSRGFGGKPGATALVIERDYGRRCVYPIKL